MKFYILIVSLLIFQTVMVESKPLVASRDFEANNEIDYENGKKIKPVDRQEAKKPASRSISEDDDSTKQIVENVTLKSNDNSGVKGDGSNSVTNQQYNPFPNLLVPLLQRLQIAPQTFFQDRLSQLKDSLVNLGLVLPGNNNATTSKQFATTNGLLNLIGLNDSGFYTDRLEPAGFLGGNGWFANKGGILGGPGAIYSTGSLLTDYPTPYKK